MDDEARPEKAPRLSVTHDSPKPPETKPPETKPSQTKPSQTKPPAKTNSFEAKPQDGRQDLGDSKANATPTPSLESNSKAANPEASPTDDSKTSRIMARLTQLKALLQDDGDQFEGHIRGLEDLEEFEEAMELLYLDDQRPDLSAGYPQTQDGFVAHCRQLFDAMKNLDNILDVVGIPGGNNRSNFTRSGDSVAVKFIKSKKSIEVILVAGKLMRAMLKAQRGRLSLPGRKFHEYGSFTLRFQAVVDALRVSKLLARSAFESEEWIDRIVINPDAELHRKKTNKTINEAKGEKQKFANMMKKNDPTIDFKHTMSPKSAETGTSAATPGPADQAQQQSDQGTAIQSPQIQTGPDTSPAPRLSKRIKTSKDQAGQPEMLGPSSASESNINQDQQPFERQATDQGQHDLQAPHDGSLDDGFTDSRLGEEAIDWSTEERSQQTDPGFPSAGMSQAFAGPGRGHGTASHDGQPAYQQLGTLALDPNPFSVAGPINDYGSGLYGPPDPGFHGQRTGGWAGFQPIGQSEGHYQDEDQKSQEDRGEDKGSVHYDG
ncbi:hypothetical protein INS49_009388 [Diaporthe citri]|uniref:uncharacterized protein n=1 Tax=Diaporthe citri TaxID=83186 RepID=UPI001C7E837F|nr:uncharacterized protein INS49_009388 [Diaporthe citri]KAG6361164.1 hypothetical protein INS49_009388 [Diaporthe citri]